MLAQTPLSATMVDFLTLAFQENCVAIVSFQQERDKKVHRLDLEKIVIYRYLYINTILILCQGSIVFLNSRYWHLIERTTVLEGYAYTMDRTRHSPFV